ncbi:hypothetical protein MPL3356_70117 [Mesorhizobium plurifarium]|uniref:Uncharacterized protein n=1 Tax=Mesorhizobium plurifarium TaxID=69974 RepID=A0A090EH17_MESPL|nr:hypothetical protein MPL3356_70117 [Mesorhizobium plurifarium]CDX63237.1 hypothetical protein MPL1032_80206 [Mesorhizobium plurifarium]
MNSTSWSKEALAFSVRLTSNCLSESGLALTLTLMAMPGALSRPRSEFGAPGLSKDRSFTYCASTLSEGWFWVPLPLAAPVAASSLLAMSLGPFAWAALLTGLKSRVRYHGLPDKTSFAASVGRKVLLQDFPFICVNQRKRRGLVEAALPTSSFYGGARSEATQRRP